MKAFFYRVETTNNVPFVSVCREVASFRGVNRNIPVTPEGAEARLERSHDGKAHFWGDLVRIRMTRIPTRIHRSGGTQDIPLVPDQGIGEETAFLYDQKLQVLALQSNRDGLSSAAVENYFSRLNAQSTSVSLIPILDLAGLQELEELATVSTVEVAFTADSELERFQPPTTVGAMIKAAKELDGPSLSMKLSVGHSWRSSSLKMGKLRSMVKYLMNHSNKVSTLKVSGHDPDARQHTLDLLKGRLLYDEGLPVTLRRESFDSRIGVLKRGLDLHKAAGKFTASQ